MLNCHFLLEQFAKVKIVSSDLLLASVGQFTHSRKYIDADLVINMQQINQYPVFTDLSFIFILIRVSSPYMYEGCSNKLYVLVMCLRYAPPDMTFFNI